MAQNDCIFIEGLKVPTAIGITDEERARPQTLVVDLALYLALENAAKTDDFNCTVDYAKVAEDVRALGRASRFHLIEAFARAAADLILRHASVSEVSVRVRKYVLQDAESVGVELRRTRQ